MYTWIIFPPLAILIIFIINRVKEYRRLLALGAPDHLIEVAKALEEARSGAAPGQENIAPIPGELPANGKLTSLQLVLYYTINIDEKGCHHHISLSSRGRGFHSPTGCSLILFLCHLLGLKPEDIEAAYGRRRVFHIGWDLSPERHRALMADPITIPTREMAKQFWDESSPSREVIQGLLEKDGE